YGGKKDYVIAGGGNTSYKSNDELWVKGSGTSLAAITETGFAVLDRQQLGTLYTKKYSEDSDTREAEVKADLNNACRPGITVRPSVETMLHEIINYAFVVHTHPTLVNAVTCSSLSGETLRDMFGERALYIPYTDPGYVLFTRVRDELNIWRQTHSADPVMIFLQNHGVFVATNSIAEIRAVYEEIEQTISRRLQQLPDLNEKEIPTSITAVLPAIRMLLSRDNIKVARIRNNTLTEYYTASAEMFSKVSLPFTPDQIVYCKANVLYLEKETPAEIIKECKVKTKAFIKTYGYEPRIIGLRNYGIIAFDDNISSVETMLDVFEDLMKISFLSENFGGPRYMTERDIAFIDNWEVENYRRQVARQEKNHGKVEHKIAVITGGAQGFGGGIARHMMHEGANVVIADINLEKGRTLVNELNNHAKKNQAICVETDVTQTPSVENLIYQTVKQFGGLDVFISNAGILRAGSLDETSPETFDLVTRVNYQAYFLCAKYASAVLKLQAEHKPGYFTDIIQINSKSGLKGSNRNFAYAGGKFGGIGLTQSFAMELIPWHIKVNAICPGNFFEGPLWSDPEKGLFVQYLKTGKVPGAKTLADVKAFYEQKVPAGRGCRVEDVMKAIYYVIDQEYETGQAVPVTGGQEMLR
ncbi:MAG: SDR family NAD(P)-dependent oxidoreductase, partial [Bacteroidales bacterium]|nr:SDR family NAD(P)-dependent oxidoreductase [Bacteroidales bacterium]